MDQKCKTCAGRGRWQENHEDKDGEVYLVWKHCNDCAGTGVSQDPEDGDDFDIDGGSYAEDD